mmetsp:Transcript_34767/g.83406  ORF Transcript_34767/g.83406 Transcript_34767/m.83406 type:complete len:221 (+) Transcript_34767:453-1115(+)
MPIARMSNTRESSSNNQISTTRETAAFHMPRISRLAKSRPRSGSSVSRNRIPTTNANGCAKGGSSTQTMPATMLVLNSIPQIKQKAKRSKARKQIKDTKVLAAVCSEPEYPHRSKGLFRPQPPALSGTRGFEDSSPTAKAELLNASFSTSGAIGVVRTLEVGWAAAGLASDTRSLPLALARRENSVKTKQSRSSRRVRGDGRSPCVTSGPTGRSMKELVP